MMPLPPYSKWLVDVACQRPRAAQPPHPEIRDPANFLTALLRVVAIAIQNGEPVTRLGMEHMLDAVFALPELTPVLDDAVGYQNAFAAAHLPACGASFQSFWDHIVRPAWDQHSDIRRICVATSAN